VIPSKWRKDVSDSSSESEGVRATASDATNHIHDIGSKATLSMDQNLRIFSDHRRADEQILRNVTLILISKAFSQRKEAMFHAVHGESGPFFLPHSLHPVSVSLYLYRRSPPSKSRTLLRLHLFTDISPPWDQYFDEMKRSSEPANPGNAKKLMRRQDPVSCEFCRRKKLKCDRVDPCSNCRARKLVCSLELGMKYNAWSPSHAY
jgi:Fungal Zn(2)-Cys(6) binuclear cluster domain